MSHSEPVIQVSRSVHSNIAFMIPEWWYYLSDTMEGSYLLTAIDCDRGPVQEGQSLYFQVIPDIRAGPTKRMMLYSERQRSQGY